MDLGKWFRHIEYLIGISNGIANKERAQHMTRCLIRSVTMFISLSENYLQHTESQDIMIMCNRATIILKNLNEKFNSYDEIIQFVNNENTECQITFFELEKWKHGIMYKVGVMMSIDNNIVKNMFKKHIRNTIKLLTLHTINYINNLQEDGKLSSQRIHDLRVLIVQVKNIYNSLK